MRTLLIICVCVAVMLSSPQDTLAEQVEDDRVEVPINAKCPVPLAQYALGPWEPQEEWAWDNRVCLGKTADLRDSTNNTSDACKPKEADHWLDDRLLSSNFIRTILFFEPFRNYLAPKGLDIACAKFEEELDISFGNFQFPIVLTNSYFQSGVNIAELKSEHNLSFEQSYFDGSIFGYGAKIEGDLNLYGTNFSKNSNVELLSAEVGRNFVATTSRIEGSLIADGMHVGGNLFLRQGKFRTVEILGVRVGGDLDVTDSYFTGSLVADRIIVDGNVFLNGQKGIAVFQQVDLPSANIGGEINAQNSCFKKELNGYGMRVNGNFFLGLTENYLIDDIDCIRPLETIMDVEVYPSRAILNGVNITRAKIGGDFHAMRVSINRPFIANRMSVSGDLAIGKQSEFEIVSFIGARVGGDIEFTENYFKSEVNFTNAQLNGTLLLNASGIFPNWGDKSSLVLRNLYVGELRYREQGLDNLRGRLDLVGFRYQNIRGFTSENIGGPDEGLRINWLLNSWLGSQRNRDRIFQPQPYQQLAMILRNMGHKAKADAIMVALHDYERTHQVTPVFEKLILTASWALLFYGYRIWQAVIWFFVLVLLGSFILQCAPSGRKVSFWQKFFFSLESAVPLIELTPLNEKFALELTPMVDRYFIVHKIFGLVIVSVLVAGMTGLVR